MVTNKTKKFLNKGLHSSLVKKFIRSSYARLTSDNKKSNNRLINFSDNENVFGPTSKVYASIKKNLKTIATYPDAEAYQLKKSISHEHTVDLNSVIVTSGVMETIRFLLTIFQKDKAHIIVTKKSFIQFRIAAKLSNFSYSEVPYVTNSRTIQQLKSKINKKTRYVFVSNPDNPSGQSTSLKNIKTILDILPSTVFLVVDEAYIEYATSPGVESCIQLTKKYPNLIVLRSFSKIYGLPGLRLGFVVSKNPIITNSLRLIMPPFNVNSLAQIAATVAIKDKLRLKKIKDYNDKEKKWLTQHLSNLGFGVSVSDANFIIIDCKAHSSQLLHKKLLSKGILVKELSNYGYPNHHRITVLKRVQNKTLIETYKKLI